MTGPDTRGVLDIEDRERIRLLTLNRPKALNAFNDDLYDAVRDALADAAERDDVAVVVVTGTGRAFSAGQDLGEMERSRRHADGEPHGFTPFIEAVEAFPKPLIAAVNGIGVGIGLTLLPHCDLVLIAEGARLRAPFVTLGVTAEAGSTALLPPRIGWQETAHLLYTAAWMDAKQAVESGLAWRICSPGSLLDETWAVAREIAAMPIPSLVATKKLLLDARLDAVRSARQREGVSFAALLGGPANRQALADFRRR
ncbi:MAG: enoyl-CoA hydratase-related protein [Proteobacteria bacterium]|nr:enoyl-CoA hydratase-related protein [Pseudomonadota bacterium]